MQRNGRLDAFDAQFAQCPLHAGDGLSAGRLVDDQLADHRIVIRRDDVAVVDVRIEPHAESAGRQPARDRARRGPEILVRIFGVDAALDALRLLLDIFLLERQRFAGRHQNLRLDQVDAGDHLGHRVLDLNAGVASR